MLPETLGLSVMLLSVLLAAHVRKPSSEFLKFESESKVISPSHTSLPQPEMDCYIKQELC